jgi:hypothetical protein
MAAKAEPAVDTPELQVEHQTQVLVVRKPPVVLEVFPSTAFQVFREPDTPVVIHVMSLVVAVVAILVVAVVEIMAVAVVVQAISIQER